MVRVIIHNKDTDKKEILLLDEFEKESLTENDRNMISEYVRRKYLPVEINILSIDAFPSFIDRLNLSDIESVINEEYDTVSLSKFEYKKIIDEIYGEWGEKRIAQSKIRKMTLMKMQEAYKRRLYSVYGRIDSEDKTKYIIPNYELVNIKKAKNHNGYINVCKKGINGPEYYSVLESDIEKVDKKYSYVYIDKMIKIDSRVNVEKNIFH